MHFAYKNEPFLLRVSQVFCIFCILCSPNPRFCRQNTPNAVLNHIGGKQFYYTLLLFEAFLESVDLACKLLGELVAELGVVLTYSLALVEPQALVDL